MFIIQDGQKAIAILEEAKNFVEVGGDNVMASLRAVERWIRNNKMQGHGLDDPVMGKVHSTLLGLLELNTAGTVRIEIFSSLGGIAFVHPDWMKVL